jgi:tetratricopeptide (TPR) repeat protein
MNSVVLLSAALPLLVAGQTWAAKTLAPEVAYERGTDLLERHQFRTALVNLEQAEKAFPRAPAVFWKLGTANAELGRPAKAILYWEKYRELAPDDWYVFPMLIQAYQAQGDTRSRDREIEALYERRKTEREAPIFTIGPKLDISRSRLGTTVRFCREQFVVARKRVFAFEYFEARYGAAGIHYQFSLVDDKSGEETSSISLVYRGTYRIRKDEGTKRLVYVQFNEKPAYEVVRKLVVDILKGKAKSVAGLSSLKAAQQSVGPLVGSARKRNRD